MTALFLALLLQVRIISFGDSLTAPRPGVITYTDVLAKVLPEVINRGVPGNTSSQARARFAADVLDNHPDLVIIQLGATDAAMMFGRILQPRSLAWTSQRFATTLNTLFARFGSKILKSF